MNIKPQTLTERIAIRLAPADAARLREIAGRRGVSEAVRRMIAASTPQTE